MKKTYRKLFFIAGLNLSLFAAGLAYLNAAHAYTIMTGSVTYNTVALPSGAFRIDNVFGGLSGWNSYITVYPNVTNAKSGTNKLGEFNLPFSYVSGQDPVTGCENALNALYSNALTVSP